MTKPPTMPGIRILTRSISAEWEDLLLGAYTATPNGPKPTACAIWPPSAYKTLGRNGAMTVTWKTQSKLPPSPITAMPRRNAAHRHAL